MKKICIGILFLFVVTQMFAQEKFMVKLFVGTFTAEGAEGIYLCNFNVETGDVSLDKTLKGIDDPSFLKLSPDKEYLYVVSRTNAEIEESGGYVCSYKVNTDGTLHFLNKQITHGTEPCYINVSPDGKYVAIANYGSGSTALYPVLANGELLPASSVIINEGTGFDKSRQTGPHAHSIRFSPWDKQVFSADLGTDKLNIYTIEDNKMVPDRQKYLEMEPGAGPRHFDFHPRGKTIFVISELNSTITSFKFQNRRWKEFQTISTLPSDFKGESYCADIHVSADGRFLYGSNRGDNSIATFVIVGNTHQLISVGTVGAVGNWPRNFTLSPDGRFMLVANQRSGNITVFEINEESGIPEFTGKEIKLPSPVCLEFL